MYCKFEVFRVIMCIFRITREFTLGKDLTSVHTVIKHSLIKATFDNMQKFIQPKKNCFSAQYVLKRLPNGDI